MPTTIAHCLRSMALGSVLLACDAKPESVKPVCPAVVCPPPPAPTPATPPRAEKSADTSDSIQIESFDCSVPQPGAAAGDPPALGISTWKAGGPAGAAWNASQLSCAATVQTSCDDGQVVAELRVGKALIASRSTPLHDRSAAFRFMLERAQWEKHFDELAASSRAPYRTAVFRVTAILTCHAPYELAPGIGPRNEFAADRAFVAGFAHGE